MEKVLKYAKNPKVLAGIAIIIAFFLGSFSDILWEETGMRLVLVECETEDISSCVIVEGEVEEGVDLIVEGSIDEVFATDAPTLEPTETPQPEETSEVTPEATEE